MKKKTQGGFLIAKIHQLSGRIFSKLLKENNITKINPSQGRILFVLWNEKKITFNDLAQKTSLGKSTLTSMLDRLEKAEYVKRVSSKKDRRTVFIKRTRKDQSLEDKYITVSKKMNQVFYKGFTSKEIDSFEKYLSRILDNLEDFE